jgi:hypothetical protein
MASMIGISNRNVFKMLVLITLIGPVTAYIAEIWIGYSFGLSKTGICRSAYTCLIPFGYTQEHWLEVPTSEPWVPYMVAGIVIVGVLSLLRARFVWFPFEPIGFLNGTSYNSLISGLWFPYLIAWILKTLTLRIGGSKAYEDYGLPIASGFALGCMLITIVATVLGICRFFIPF